MEPKVNIYRFTATDFGGKEVTNSIMAVSEEAARKSLERRGLKVKTIVLIGAQG